MSRYPLMSSPRCGRWARLQSSWYTSEVRNSGRMYATAVSCGLATVVVCAGCATRMRIDLPAAPAYPGTKKVDVSVELLLTDSFRNYEASFRPTNWTFDTVYLALGKTLCENTEVLARRLFEEVIVTEGNQPRRDGVAVVLSPAVESVDQIWAQTAFGEGHSLITVTWSLTDPGGTTVWQDRIVGEASGPWGTGFTWMGNLQERMQTALEQLFLNSFEAMSHSERIRSLRQNASKRVR